MGTSWIWTNWMWTRWIWTSWMGEDEEKKKKCHLCHHFSLSILSIFSQIPVRYVTSDNKDNDTCHHQVDAFTNSPLVSNPQPHFLTFMRSLWWLLLQENADVSILPPGRRQKTNWFHDWYFHQEGGCGQKKPSGESDWKESVYKIYFPSGQRPELLKKDSSLFWKNFVVWV